MPYAYPQASSSSASDLLPCTTGTPDTCPLPSLHGSTARGSCGIHNALLPERSRGCASATQFVDRGSCGNGRSPLEHAELDTLAVLLRHTTPPVPPPSVHAVKASPFFSEHILQ